MGLLPPSSRTIEERRKRTVKVAVIGSGLAGLSAAYLLTKGTKKNDDNNDIDFEVHLFEKNKVIGMDAASISVGTEEEDMRIDVPMRSFMSGYYAHLVRLYEHLSIPVKPASFSFGWYSIESRSPTLDLPAHDIASHTDNRSYLTYSGARTVGRLSATLGPSSSSSTGSSSSGKWHDGLSELLFSWYVTLVVAFSYTWLMILTLWLHHRGHLRNAHHPIANMTLGQWFQHHRIHPYFVQKVFVPLFAAVCTNSWQAMLNYPATEVLEYMALGLFQESYVVTHGVRQVVDRLQAPLNNIHLGVHIQSIQPVTSPTSSSSRRYLLQDHHGQTYECDHIIFATQGNQAQAMLQTCYDHVHRQEDKTDDTLASTLEQQLTMLKQFSYDTSLVINHTDTRLLPSDRRHWRALNFALVDRNIQPDPTSDSRYIVPFPHDTTMTTHILNWTHTRFGPIDFDDHHDDADADDDKLSLSSSISSSSSTSTSLSSTSSVYLQTTNPCISPDPKHILSASWFERATVTLASKKAIESDLFPKKKQGDITLGACQGTNNIWFVGSYCWRGIPLLEGCVASAEKVVTDGIAAREGIELKSPW